MLDSVREATSATLRLLRNDWIQAILSNAVIGILGLLSASIAARMLGPEGRGALTAVLLWGGLLFTALGLPGVQAVVYAWSRAGQPVRKSRVLGAALALAGSFSIIVIPIALIINQSTLGKLDAFNGITAATTYLVALPLSLYAGILGSTFLAEGRTGDFWGIRLINSISYLGVLIAMWAFGEPTVVGASIAAASGIICSAAWARSRFIKHLGIRPQWDRQQAIELARYGGTTNLAGLPAQLNMRIDQALMALLLPTAVLGQYAVAFSWATIVTMLGGGLSSILLARSSAQDLNATDAYSEIFSQYRRVILAVTALGLLAALLAPLGILLLFGQSYHPALGPTYILCLANIFLTLSQCLHEIARGLGHPKVGVPAEFAGLVVNALLLLTLLTRLGGIGAAIASLVSYITTFSVLVFQLDRQYSGNLRRHLVPHRKDIDQTSREIHALLSNIPLQSRSEMSTSKARCEK